MDYLVTLIVPPPAFDKFNQLFADHNSSYFPTLVLWRF